MGYDKGGTTGRTELATAVAALWKILEALKKRGEKAGAMEVDGDGGSSGAAGEETGGGAGCSAGNGGAGGGRGAGAGEGVGSSKSGRRGRASSRRRSQ